MFESVEPLTLVELAVFPLVPSTAFRFAFGIVAFVGGSIGKLLESLAMFEIVKPVALVEAAIDIHHDALATSPALLHLSKVH